jgi:hypothetical protein
MSCSALNAEYTNCTYLFMYIWVPCRSPLGHLKGSWLTVPFGFSFFLINLRLSARFWHMFVSSVLFN